MLRLFYSYSRKDSSWCDRIAAHLKGLEPHLVAEAWYDRKIRPGEEWNAEISKHLEDADIILLLVSANFFASEYCGLEAERAMERHDSGSTVVVPVMLHPYNLAGGSFAKLNTLPPGDPISNWTDHEAALAEVSKGIEEIARKLLGAGSKNKLPHPNREDLSLLLHHLCNRTPQRDALQKALRPEKRKPRRPFAIVTRGYRQDAHEWFVDRLQHVHIPVLLGSKPGRLSPIEWPEYSARSTPLELFGSKLADCVPDTSPWATDQEINAAFKQCSPISLLPATVSAADWGADGSQLFEAYLRFWEEWPPLPEDRLVLPLISVKYGHDEDNKRISDYLDTIGFDAKPGLGGVVLPPFRELRRTDVETWIQHQRVRELFRSPEQAIGHLDAIFTEEDRTFPMQPFAEVYFPRFLDRL